MKKRKKDHRDVFVVFFLAALFTAGLFLFKNSSFNKPIPDVVELPKDVKESIKNLKPQKNLRVPILLYHYVEYVKDEGDTIRKSLNITPYTFEEEIKTLKDAGYEFITMKDLANALDDKVNLPAKSVILTFDDGYRDFYTDVFPILKKYRAKAVAFVVPNFLDLPNNLTSLQLKELIQSGLVEIGAHSMGHTYLSGLPLQKVRDEVEGSKKNLEAKLKVPVTSFAYPYGAFDNATIEIVKKAGFRSAVTTISGNLVQDINRFFLYRIRPSGLMGQELLDLVENSKSSKY